jgi:hypothetical protein
MNDRQADTPSDPRPPRRATRRAALVGAAAALLGAGIGVLSDNAHLALARPRRHVRNRRRNRNRNKSQETAISIPGEPGKNGEPGDPPPVDI